MQTIGATFDGSAIVAGIDFATRRIWRQPMRELLRLLDRLVPRRHAVDAGALPPEFFNYPPV